MKIVVAIIFSVFLASCPSQSQENSFDSVFKGSLAGDGSEGFQRENRIIENQAAWKEFLSKLNSGNPISEQFSSEIDFSKNILVAVIDSPRNTGGFSIEIVKVKEQGSKLEITVASKGPKPTDMVTMVLTQPIHIVKIPKTSKEVVFVTQ